jgi:predicted permease
MWWQRIVSKASGTLHRRSADRQLDLEIASHLAMLEEKFKRQGLPEPEAKLAARREFGGAEQIKEEYRERRGFNHLEQLARDFYFGFRSLRRSPGFSLVALLSLALGIGMNAAIFTLLNAIVLQTLPVPHPERLVEVQVFSRALQDYQNFFSYPFYRQLQAQNTIFDGVTAQWGMSEFQIGAKGGETTVNGTYISGTYFQFARANAYLGRLLSVDDDGTVGAHPVCTISYQTWKRLGADPRLVGSTIRVNDKPLQIVGITEPDFTGLSLQNPPDIEVPMSMVGYLRRLHRDDARTLWLNILAHLKPGISTQEASERVNALAKRIIETLPRDGPYDRTASYRVKPAPRGFDQFASMSRPLVVLMSTVALVLIIALLNLANLLLARGQEREREIAMRLSLGASRWRVVRQLLIESACLAAGGAALGYGAATGLVNLLVLEFNKGKTYGRLEVSPDLRVLLFTALLATVAVLLFGAIPAWLASNVNPQISLKGASQGTVTQARSSELRKSLLFLQVVLTMILLVAAGLFEHSLRNLRTINIGAEPDHIVMAELTLTSMAGKRYAPVSFLNDLQSRVGQMSDVASVAYGLPGLLSGAIFNSSISIPGKPALSSPGLQTLFSEISPNYLRTVGIPLVVGRDFTSQDRKGSAPVAIVNEKFAATYFPRENALGKQFRGAMQDKTGPVTIVGVVKDIPYFDLRDGAKSMVYRPTLQLDSPWRVLTVRVRNNPEAFENELAALVRSLAPGMPLQQFKTVALQRDASIARDRLLAILSMLFALLALALSAIGLYGLVSYSIAKRTREVGIRLTLGAKPSDVLKLFLNENLSIVIVAAAVGSILALIGARLVRSLLFGLPGTDISSLYFAAGTLLAIALLASLIPAARAARIDPAQALRAE